MVSKHGVREYLQVEGRIDVAILSVGVCVSLMECLLSIGDSTCAFANWGVCFLDGGVCCL